MATEDKKVVNTENNRRLNDRVADVGGDNPLLPIVVVGLFVNLLYDLGKGVFSAIFDNPLSASLKSIVSSGKLLDAMSSGGRTKLESSAKDAQKLVNSIRQDEENAKKNPSLRGVYSARAEAGRLSLSWKYKEMGSIIRDEVSNNRLTLGYGDPVVLEEAARTFDQLSGKVVNSNFPLPKEKYKSLLLSETNGDQRLASNELTTSSGVGDRETPPSDIEQNIKIFTTRLSVETASDIPEEKAKQNDADKAKEGQITTSQDLPQKVADAGGYGR
jgi:hypothetical protein